MDNIILGGLDNLFAIEKKDRYIRIAIIIILVLIVIMTMILLTSFPPSSIFGNIIYTLGIFSNLLILSYIMIEAYQL